MVRRDRAVREELLATLKSADPFVTLKIHVILTEAFEPRYKSTRTEFNGVTVLLTNDNKPVGFVIEVPRIKERWLNYFAVARKIAKQEREQK